MTATISTPIQRPARAGAIAATNWLTAPGHAGSLAIIAPGRVYVCRNADPYRNPPRPFSHRLSGADLTSLAPVAQWALGADVENVFILPGAGRFSRDFRDLASVARMRDEAGPDFTFHELTSRKLGAARFVGIIARRARGGAPCTIWGPLALDVWGLGALPQDVGYDEQANNLAHAWLLASYALGIRPRNGPSYSGLALLRNMLASGRQRNFAQPSEKYQELIALAEAKPLAWMPPARAVDDPDAPVKVWTYDRNWSYVSSARVVPIGDPIPVGEFVSGRPGIYRVNAQAPARWRETMPDPFQRGKLENIWAWEPQMRCARDAGWTVELLEGYAWIGAGSSHDLRPWNERMWRARNDLAHRVSIWGAPAIAARGMVSQIGRATIGRLKREYGNKLVESASEDDEIVGLEIGPNGLPTGMVEVHASGERTDMTRPEWRSTIIANASERPVTMSYAHARYDSLALNVDSLSAPSPRGLEGPTDKPGGWHLEYAGVEIPASIAYGGNLDAFNKAVAKAARNG